MTAILSMSLDRHARSPHPVSAAVAPLRRPSSSSSSAAAAAGGQLRALIGHGPRLDAEGRQGAQLALQTRFLRLLDLYLRAQLLHGPLVLVQAVLQLQRAQAARLLQLLQLVDAGVPAGHGRPQPIQLRVRLHAAI